MSRKQEPWLCFVSTKHILLHLRFEWFVGSSGPGGVATGLLSSGSAGPASGQVFMRGVDPNAARGFLVDAVGGRAVVPHHIPLPVAQNMMPCCASFETRRMSSWTASECTECRAARLPKCLEKTAKLSSLPDKNWSEKIRNQIS